MKKTLNAGFKNKIMAKATIEDGDLIVFGVHDDDEFDYDVLDWVDFIEKMEEGKEYKITIEVDEEMEHYSKWDVFTVIAIEEIQE